MKKNLLIVAAIAIAATSVLASEVRDNAFVGLEIGSTSYDIKAEDLSNGDSLTLNDSGGSQSVKVGKYLGEAGRVYGFIGRVNADSASIQTYGVGYDYLIYNSSPVTPFVGATLGYQQIDLDNFNIDLSGMTYGAELGAQYVINKNIDIEAGYRMNFSSTDDTISNVKITIDDVNIWYIGFNYNF